MTFLFIFLALVIGFVGGGFTFRRGALMYRQRWLEAKKLWEDERVAPLPEKTGAPPAPKVVQSKGPDYHYLEGPDRLEIARERYKKGLPIEDDLKGLVGQNWKSFCGEEIMKLRLKQEREARK